MITRCTDSHTHTQTLTLTNTENIGYIAVATLFLSELFQVKVMEMCYSTAQKQWISVTTAVVLKGCEAYSK